MIVNSHRLGFIQLACKGFIFVNLTPTFTLWDSTSLVICFNTSFQGILNCKKTFCNFVNRYIMRLKNILMIILYVNAQSQETDSLETRTEQAVLRSYVENQAILEPILLQQASKGKQTKEQGSEDCLWTQLFFFFMSRCKHNKIKLCYNRLQFAKEIQTNTV